MRLIDADELLKNAVCLDNVGGATVVCVEDIRDTPTIELIKHGEWKAIINAYGEYEGWIHEDCGRQTEEACNYCPNCGTKMDLGD